MRLCSSEQPAHISLIRRRSRSIVSRASASSGIHPNSPAQGADINIDREIEDAVTNRLTAGPSISARGENFACPSPCRNFVARSSLRDGHSSHAYVAFSHQIAWGRVTMLRERQNATVAANGLTTDERAE